MAGIIWLDFVCAHVYLHIAEVCKDASSQHCLLTCTKMYTSLNHTATYSLRSGQQTVSFKIPESLLPALVSTINLPIASYHTFQDTNTCLLNHFQLSWLLQTMLECLPFMAYQHHSHQPAHCHNAAYIFICMLMIWWLNYICMIKVYGNNCPQTENYPALQT